MAPDTVLRLGVELRRADPARAAPGLPREAVPAGWELELVADRRDLKEAVLWSLALATTARRATVLSAGDTLESEPGPAVEPRLPGAFLLDPTRPLPAPGWSRSWPRRWTHGRSTSRSPSCRCLAKCAARSRGPCA